MLWRAIVFGWVLGLNGVILLAYVVTIPANEIVIPPVLYTIYKETGSLKWPPFLTATAGHGVLVIFFIAQIWRLVVACNELIPSYPRRQGG